MNLSYFLKMARTNAGLSQRDLAHKTGIATTLLSRYENGRVTPRPETLNRIALGIGVPLSNFFDVQVEAKLVEPQLTTRAAYDEASSNSMMLSILDDEDALYFYDNRCCVNKKGMSKIWFPFESFVQGLNVDRLVGHFVADSSMAKQFKRGSLVLIDTGNQRPISGHFVCLVLNGQLMIKLITAYNKKETTFVSADANGLIPPLSLKTGEFDIVGTIIWKSEAM